MDAKDSFSGGYEQALPVLSRSPATAPWPATHDNSQPDPLTVLPTTSTSTLPPAEPLPISPAAPPASQPSDPQSSQAAPSEKTERNAPAKVRKPRRAANASAGKSTLFWVHTDPESASGGTKEETLKRIRSHVMSEHNRKKRLESTKRYKGKSWKHLSFQTPETVPGTIGPSPPPPSSSSSSSHGSQFIDESDTKQELTPETTPPIDYYANASQQGWFNDEVVEYQDQSTSLATWSVLGSGAHDPFNTGHTQLTDRMLRHLQNFLWDLTQEAHPLQTRYKPKLQAHWASLIQRDPAVLHASICTRSDLVVDTFHHRGETIRLVNEGLSDPVKASSDELIAAVSALLTIEIASGNPDYLKIHLAGLRQMIGLRKNFADVPPDVRFQISWTDIRVACMAMTRPIFPFVRSSRPMGLTLSPPNDDIALLATRLLPLVKIPGIFSDVFAKIIYDLLELTWYAEWIKGSTGYKNFNEETEDYFNFEVVYVEYALHSDRYTPTGQAKGDNSMEGCVRLACLCFHNSAIWTFYPMIAPLLPKPITALRAALEATIPSGVFALCRDLLIWLLFIGAACSQVMPSERAFFVSELATACRLHGVTSWQEARSILLGFFYVDRAHLHMLRQIWQEVQLQSDLSAAR
ncbi:hypothetical protein N7481_003922 [Penicillium waksmanii]|uniref:uncharacterized protein n=1 Tax=Penicillium waksmanii TaxID=69791 RepID=UPI002548FBDD|nr:uncharacterized protein N7481_003922 [Penicillium waksmanii]KAJ5988712.1 hypothetical protein N7481_003922 [Penicillium waksmanii]